MLKKSSSKIEKIVQEARDSDKVKVFLGGSCKDNSWRESIQKEFGDYFFFIDPFDEDWDPEDNIYDELAGMVNADYIVFYRGGDLSEREKGFLDNIGRSGELVKEFDDMDKLKAFLKDIKSKKVRLASVSDVLVRLARSLCKDAMPQERKGNVFIDFFFEKIDKESRRRVIEDFTGLSIEDLKKVIPGTYGDFLKLESMLDSFPEALFTTPGKTINFSAVHPDYGPVNKRDLDRATFVKIISTALALLEAPANVSSFKYDSASTSYVAVESYKKNAKIGATYSKASTQVDLPEQLSLEVMAWGKTNIPDKDLYTKDDKGREDEIHATLFYGITEDAEDKLRELLSGVKPFECRLGLVTTFKDKKECDVIKIDVESSEMVKLHYLIRESVKNKNEYPTYAPHITVAYVKKGKADRVLGDDRFRGATFKVTEIVYSTKDHNKIKIPLGL